MKSLRNVTAGLVTLLVANAAQAAPFVLTFEGLQNLEPIQNFYNGGTGGSGSGPGTNFNVAFGSNALAVIDADAGGSGNIGGEPSPSTVMFFLTGSAILNYTARFDTGFSFFYSAISSPAIVNVYDGLNATGTLLTTINLPLTPYNGAPDPTGNFSPFVAAGGSFAGIAKSIDFGGTVNQIAFDDITFGSSTPGAVPEPASLLLLGGSLLAMAAVRRRRPAGSNTCLT